jgi:hypothetical protein
MTVRDLTFPGSVTPTVGFRDTPARSLPLIALVLSMRRSGSARVPRESLDGPGDLPKQAPRQAALGKLDREGCGKLVSDQH